MLVPRGRPLLGDTHRAWAWLTLAACVLVIAALGLPLRGQTRPDRLDDAVDAAMVTFFGGRHSVLRWLALPGSTVPLIAVSMAIAAGCLIARRPRGVVLAVTVVPVAAFLNDALLKHFFHRTYLGELSFPSGHTTSATALTATLAVLLLVPPQRARTRTARVALVTVAAAVTALVATGVIGLRWHYFTDTVGGVALGTGTALALALLIDLAPGAMRRRLAA